MDAVMIVSPTKVAAIHVTVAAVSAVWPGFAGLLTDQDLARVELGVELREDGPGRDRRSEAAVSEARRSDSRHEDAEGHADGDEDAAVAETVCAVGEERLREAHGHGCD